MKKTLFATMFCVALASAAHAKPEAAPGLVTGPETGTYVTIGRDIARVAKEDGLDLIVKTSGGSVENIRRIASSGENAAAGIVQSDVLTLLRRSKNARSAQMAKNLRMIFPFYREEVHVLARKDIATLADLKGKRVVVGLEGSGSMLTAMNLFSLLGIQPSEVIRRAAPEGVVAVLVGEADAVIFTGGKPVRLFKKLETMREDKKELLDKVHFLPVDDPKIVAEYDIAAITPADYAFVQKEVPTVAATAMLVSFDFSSKKNAYYVQRCKQIGALAASIRNHLDALRKDGHPKWNEVDPGREVSLWKRDACAAAAPAPKPAQPDIDSSLERDLLSIINGGPEEKR